MCSSDLLSNPTYNAVQQGDNISLFLPDVIKVRKVIAGNTTNYPDANNFTDVTDHFGLLSGMTDEEYDHAALQLLSGYDTVNAKLLVHVDFFQHIYTAGANVSYFSVDSYDQSLYYAGVIPIYKSMTSSKDYYLRDCLEIGRAHV